MTVLRARADLRKQFFHCTNKYILIGVLVCSIDRCIFLRVVPYFDSPTGWSKYKRVKIYSDTTHEKHLIRAEVYYPTAVVNKFISERGSVTVLRARADLYGKQVFYCTISL